MEKLKAEGKIKYYGISSYSAFRVNSSDNLHLNLQSIKRLADRVAGGESGFCYITTPINIVMSEAFIEKHQMVENSEKKHEAKELLRAAEDLAINVLSVSPFLSGFLLETPLNFQNLKSLYIPVKHLNLIR